MIDLLHLEEYVELFEVFKNTSRELSTEIAGIRSKIATVEKWLTDNKLDDTTILPMLKIENDTDELEKEFRSLTMGIENISEKNKKILKNNQYIKLLKDIDIDKIQSIEINEKQSYDGLQADLGTLNGVVAGSRKLIKKLHDLEDKCPTCEQTVNEEFKETLIAEETDKVSFAQEKMRDITTRIEKIKRQNEQFEYKTKMQRDWKTSTEVSTELSQWPSWIKESLKNAWREYELTWFRCKSLYRARQRKMKDELDRTHASK